MSTQVYNVGLTSNQDITVKHSIFSNCISLSPGPSINVEASVRVILKSLLVIKSCTTNESARGGGINLMHTTFDVKSLCFDSCRGNFGSSFCFWGSGQCKADSLQVFNSTYKYHPEYIGGNNLNIKNLNFSNSNIKNETYNYNYYGSGLSIRTIAQYSIKYITITSCSGSLGMFGVDLTNIDIDASYLCFNGNNAQSIVSFRLCKTSANFRNVAAFDNSVTSWYAGSDSKLTLSYSNFDFESITGDVTCTECSFSVGKVSFSKMVTGTNRCYLLILDKSELLSTRKKRSCSSTLDFSLFIEIILLL